MRTLSAEGLLDLCDRGARAGHAGRALLLLHASGLDPDTAASLAVGERNRRLIAWRERLFGRDLEATASCPGCSQRVELNVDAQAVLSATEGAIGGEHLALIVDGHDVRYRLPCTGDFAALRPAVGDSRADLLKRWILTIDGAAPDPAVAVPTAIARAVESAMAAADPGAVVALEMACPACGHLWAVFFDSVSFLWRELEQRARRLLDDVHCLARSYGWSEAQILRLSEARRQGYLQRLLS